LNLDPNLSPLGGETTSILVSKFLSDLHYDPYPIVKQFSATADWNDFKQIFQVQVVVAAIERRDTLIEWLVSAKIILETTNNLNNHDITCTYDDVFNIIQRENEAYTVFYVSNYHGEPTDQVSYDGKLPNQVTSDWHMIIDSVEGLSQNDIPKPPIKIVPRITLVDSKCYHNMFIKPSDSSPVDEISKQWKHQKS
jgi:hypothetical protein